jgi:hypothetical protein
VQKICLTFVKIVNKRRLLAALFLIFLLAEWGSHGVVNAKPSSLDQQAVSSDEGGHDDPCRFLVLCSDSGRKDRQMPRFGHQVMHNGLLDLLSDLRPPVGFQDDLAIPFTTANCLSRPPDPAFHPPELS